jgi:tRNA-specific 2-thiouridylase
MFENQTKRVVIAMSGGVDSSVAAFLLKQQGYEVIGMMLRLWNEAGKDHENRCCTPDSIAMAKRVAAKLGIQFYVIDAREVFLNSVVQYFIEGYTRGVTPNPCLVCNRKVRWEFLLGKAASFGADFMATGHYVRIRQDPQQQIQLLKAMDRDKDQSYVLHILNQAQLKKALFPLGELTKIEVRQLARDANLPVADRPESQDLCFLAGEDYRPFLERNASQEFLRGPILDTQGHIIGQHRGLPFYTIGQRKGLGISAAEPMYVLSKDLQTNSLIVGTGDKLGKTELVARSVHWISGSPQKGPILGNVKIRYKAKEIPAEITPLDEQSIHIRFQSVVRDITPGQAAVIYQEEICLGGGIIE